LFRVQQSERLPTSLLMAFYHILKLSPQAVAASKEREVVNKLIGILPVFFDLQDVEPRCNPLYMPEMNLNKIILMQTSNFPQ